MDKEKYKEKYKENYKNSSSSNTGWIIFGISFGIFLIICFIITYKSYHLFDTPINTTSTNSYSNQALFARIGPE